MKDFNSYVNGQGNGSDKGRGANQNTGSGDFLNGSIDISTVLNALAGKYEGADEKEIISAIIAEAEKGRRNGTLTDEALKSFEATVSPMLTPEQRKKLSGVVKFLLKR